jgi:hypothetical protein
MHKWHVWFPALFPPTKTGLKEGSDGDDVVRKAFPSLFKRGMFSLSEVVQVDFEVTPDSGGGRFLLTLFQRQMF